MSVEQEYQTEVQEEQMPEVDYAALWPRVQALAGAHPELVNFAYLLELFQFCVPCEQAQAPFSYSMRVNLCSTALPPSDAGMHTSRLEQIYTTFFFTDEYFSYLLQQPGGGHFQREILLPDGEELPGGGLPLRPGPLPEPVRPDPGLRRGAAVRQPAGREAASAEVGRRSGRGAEPRGYQGHRRQERPRRLRPAAGQGHLPGI